MSRHNLPGNGGEGVPDDGLGVSPDGSAVFVTGFSPRLDSGLDYATVRSAAS